MVIKTKEYGITMSPEELDVLRDALTYAYNSLYNKQHPEKSKEEFYRDAVNDPMKRILNGGKMETLERLNRTVQREFGCGQSW